MRTGRLLVRAVTIVGGACVLYLSAPAVQTQGAKSRASKYAVSPAFDPSYVAPRTPDGQPDLQGVYNNFTLTPNSRPRELGDKEFFDEAEAAQLEKTAAVTPCKGISFDLR